MDNYLFILYKTYSVASLMACIKIRLVNSDVCRKGILLGARRYRDARLSAALPDYLSRTPTLADTIITVQDGSIYLVYSCFTIKLS